MISGFERHSQIMRIIIILKEKGEVNFQSFIDEYEMSSTTLYRTLDKLKSMGIISTRIDTKSYPNKTMIFLTEKGHSVAQKLKEIEEILKG